MMLWIFRRGWWCRTFHPKELGEIMIRHERWLICAKCHAATNQG